MINYFFFTDVDKLNNQNAGEEFGPLNSSSLNDEFRTTSLHSAISTANAYSICDGFILAQSTPDPNIINLIVKPLSVLSLDTGKVNYFIYKGIIKSELIDGNFIAVNTNDLTSSINTSQQLYNNNYDEINNNPAGYTTDRPLSEILAIQINNQILPDNNLLSSIFQKDDSFTIPIVKAGWSIGKFDPARFGLEVISEHLGFDITLDVSRKIENIISVPKNPTASTYLDFYTERNAKEFSLSFIDPCSVFASFYYSGISVKDSAGSTTIMKEDALYSTLIEKFYNKNITYILIKDERNYSFNFFNEFDNNVNLDFGSGVQSVSYFREFWPVLRIQNSEFPPSNTNSKNVLSIAFPLGTNNVPMLYLENARKDSGNPVSRIKKFAKNAGAFIKLEQDNSNILHTQQISLAVPNASGSGTLIPSNYIILKYCRGFDFAAYPKTSSEGNLFPFNHYLDNLFRPFDFKNPWGTSPSNEVFVEYLEEDLYCSDIFHLLYDCVVSTGKAVDNSNVTLFAVITEKSFLEKSTQNSPFSFSTIKVKNYPDFLQFVSNYQKNSSTYRRSNLIISGQSVPVVSIENADLDCYINSESVNYDDFIFLTISKAEFDSLENLKNAAAFYPTAPVYLSLTLINKGHDDLNIYYEEYNLGLRSFELVDNDLQVKEVSSAININFYAD